MSQPAPLSKATRLIVRRMHRLAVDARMMGDTESATAIAAMADLLWLKVRLGEMPQAAAHDAVALAA